MIVDFTQMRVSPIAVPKCFGIGRCDNSVEELDVSMEGSRDARNGRCRDRSRILASTKWRVPRPRPGFQIGSAASAKQRG